MYYKQQTAIPKIIEADFHFVLIKNFVTFKEREGLFNSPHVQVLCVLSFHVLQTADCADFHFVLIKNLSPQVLCVLKYVVHTIATKHFQEVKKKYQNWKKDDTELCICFEKDAIRLDLTEIQEVDPWKIVPLKTSQVHACMKS